MASEGETSTAVRLIREDLMPFEVQLEQVTPRAVANLFNVRRANIDEITVMKEMV